MITMFGIFKRLDAIDRRIGYIEDNVDKFESYKETTNKVLQVIPHMIDLPNHGLAIEANVSIRGYPGEYSVSFSIQEENKDGDSVEVFYTDSIHTLEGWIDGYLKDKKGK